MGRSGLKTACTAWRHNSAVLFHDRRRRRVGLLGGSFNPAHDGHIHISKLALRRLRLDEIWWLVSPQNPLKDSGDMAPVSDRLVRAREIVAKHNFIKVIAPEVRFGTAHTYRTLYILKKRAPRIVFSWIMGADNMVQFESWQQHARIKMTIPIAVIDRPSYSYRALSAGRKLLSRRVSSGRFARLGHNRTSGPPVWCFVAGRRHHASATALRALQEM